MTEQTLTLSLKNPEETARYAMLLGAQLQPGDVVLLEGDVGAGKTHFARSLIQSLLRHPEDVPSPTFTLVQTYPTDQGDIWHADLYRLTSTHEIEELGLADAFETDICLVEWPDRLGSLLPEHALTLSFSSGDEEQARHLTIRWTDVKWDNKLKDWRK
ncbi:tRNA (adenosine(37)-N6)-threonylcarbamoyltransferase complex ATPase subunit type 1 TsaE [Sulfitobacter sp. JBTF-M27]|uniref:tRNA threonylcarbamoyladenosine biosynthesis protein TsaE n=1 Tax=Sulfitobacter sediminilitoris TaxID=2698830 RepID=A0A6P0C5Y1_9RHOB|nr:tRNA (adenosine(37)-N6)-threonylcarbamoyltransferase complex ATPase subunit type 1 TsaE [Sulfitobacter sediminilitoris]NEK21522.1 tRNA (adenosine(37)-N6)-threonylcarbamoyltransferase complex ATPase subunit type 1 TsaE [Sulfitobacter sediminilitoris]